MKCKIDGKFPVIANWLTVISSTEGRHIIKNALTGEWFELDDNTFCFLKRLDGNNDPSDIGRKYGFDTDALMDILDANFLIRTKGRKLLSDCGTLMRTVYIPRNHTSKSIVPKLLNMLLLICWCPVLIYGVRQILHGDFRLDDDYMLLGYFISIILGSVMHEVSHAVACLACGGSCFEAGIMIWHYVHPGAYVLMDYSKVRSKLKRVQVDAAGIEMNLLLAGISLILAKTVECLSGCFLLAAINNIFLAVMNASFIGGLDGCVVIGELLGIKGGLDGARAILRRNLKKARWTDMSTNNKAVTITCAILAVYQVLLPIAILNSILILMGVFI